MQSPLAEFFAGVRAELPILVGVVPFGMIFGVLALDAGLTRLQAQSMSVIVFAGSSQIVFAQLVHLGAPGWVIVLTTAVVNLRHALYSASLAPYLQRLRPAWKWLLSYLLTDEAYAVTVINYQNCPEPVRSGRERAAHGCRTGHAALVFPGRRSGFMDLLAAEHRRRDRPGRGRPAELVAGFHPRPDLHRPGGAQSERPGLRWSRRCAPGLVALLAFSAPYKLGLIIAALVGILIGLLVEAKA